MARAKSPKRIKKDAVVIPKECAAIVLYPDGKSQVYVSDSGKTNDNYSAHDEVCIAIGALMQNQTFIEASLTTFRRLFDIAAERQEEQEV